MFKEQTGFKFRAVRRKRNGVAGGRERKGFEIAIDENEKRIGRRNGNVRRLRHGIRKRHERIARSNGCASVTHLEINGFVVLHGENLHAAGKFIQFLDLNGSANQNLHVFSFKSDARKMTDHRLMISGQLRAGGTELGIVKCVKMLCKILCGKFRNAKIRYTTHERIHLPPH